MRDSETIPVPRTAPKPSPEHDATPLRHGLLLVDKHSGCTSHDVVLTVRRMLGTRKVGHCGTLDPNATGLLLITVGRATRLTRFLIRAPKVYEGTIRFGLETDTYDLSGETVAEATPEELARLDDAAIREAMAGFTGTYLQTPPPYCAKKVGGKKYYELARRGEETPKEKKPVVVHEFAPIADYRPGEELPFVLSCSSGTYARSLVHELGAALGCGAALATLRRTQISSLYRLERAATIEELRRRFEHGEGPGDAWIPFDDVPLPFGEIVVDAQQTRRLEHGQTILVRDVESQEGDWLKLTDPRGQFIAVGAVAERIGTGNVAIVQPKVVFRRSA